MRELIGFFKLLSIALLIITCSRPSIKTPKDSATLCAKIEMERTHDFDLLVISRPEVEKNVSPLIYSARKISFQIYCFENLKPGEYALAYGDSVFSTYFFSSDLIKSSRVKIRTGEISSMGRFKLKVKNSFPISLAEIDTENMDKAQRYYSEIWLKMNHADKNKSVYFLTTGTKEEFSIMDEIKVEPAG